MRIRRLPATGLLLLGLWFFSSTTYAQDLVLTGPPRETPAAGLKLYGPLADYLTKLFGRKVTYVHPGNWLSYQHDMRADKYDIIFDGPHFASWRILHLGNTAVVRLPGNLQFYLLAKKDDNNVKEINDMVGKTFCGLPPPNLATMAIISAFPNPVRQPVIQGIRGTGKLVLNTFLKGDQCVAAVLRSQFYKRKMTDQQRAEVKIVYTTKPYPNQGITVSQRVTPKERALMVQALTVGDGVKATAPILKRFAGKAKHMIPDSNADFAGLNNLLEGVIFGWE